MGKYRRYKNIIEMFLSSEKGKRVLNFCYSWGASVVIIGALFKLLHLPYANQILFVAMITEAAVFFISAFERPNDEYHWEDVFPVLKSKNPLDRPDFSKGSEANGGNGIQVGGVVMNMGNDMSSNTSAVSGAAAAASLGLNVTEEDTRNLSDSIKKLSGAAEQISKMAELTEATQKYLEQLSSMSEQMEKFSQVTNSLTSASDTLLNAYQHISDNSDGISQNSKGYVQQMEALNQNISGLNAVYEAQLRSISMQIENIEQINAGLSRIKDMYNGSVVDSSVFRSETEKMTQQLAQLNQVYSRLLQAMTVNMAPQQPMYQQQPYQQPMYQQPYGYQQPYNAPKQG
ncbi:MAG: gliding motility protein GldL [Parabacteroides sp.]|nr:gliding motility protein GldL [Parabacteroides sp.]